MSKRILSAIIIVSLYLVGCGTDVSSYFIGKYCDIEGMLPSVTYTKDYIMMDCCEEWPLLVSFVQHQHNISAAEGIEFYFYDEDGNKVSPDGNFTVHVSLNEGILAQSGSTYEAYLLGSNQPVVVKEENGIASFETNQTGIYVIVKKDEHAKDPWIYNEEDCHNQCKTCSGDW